MASNTAIGTINNKGNLGAGLKDATTSEALKSYAVSGITAGLTAGLYDNWTGTQTGASNTGAVSNNSGVLANTFAAAGFNWVGDFSQELKLTEGGLAKIGLHAIIGGLAAEAAGGDFKSGALVAGANEALIDTLANQYDNMSHEL